MPEIRNIVVIQTAFVGDVILTLPLLQVVKRIYPSARIAAVVVPRSVGLLETHPAVNRVLSYDKRGRDSGLAGFRRIVRELRAGRFDLALVPHRSIRSAALAAWARIPLRIGFSSSAGRFLFTSSIRREQSLHEVERNLSLLRGLGEGRKNGPEREFPRIYPAAEDVSAVDEFLRLHGCSDGSGLVALAPGTVWNTKRWPEDRFAELSSTLASEGKTVLLIGGAEDARRCTEILRHSTGGQVVSAAGTLSLLQSAELIRRCSVLVSNDSAPMHLALAVGTPVVAIYGATIPGFGFAPFGPRDTVVETTGLRCRPCSIHGGERCPIGTFECMIRISAGMVLDRVHEVLSRPR